MIHDKVRPYWLTFTIRNDCCLPEDVTIFDRAVKKHGVPAVVTFWTKQPVLVAKLFKTRIERLRSYGTYVLSMITLNGYGPEMESGREEEYDDPGDLMNIVDMSYFRGDPLIPGYTTRDHLRPMFQYAKKYHTRGLDGIKLSFITFHRHGIGKLFRKQFPHVIQKTTTSQKFLFLKKIITFGNEICSPYQPQYIHCAESSNLEGLTSKPCHDIEVIIKYAPEIGQYLYDHRTTQKYCVANRPDCTCFPYVDGGLYGSWKGGHKCKNQCKYCYAKGK